MSVISQLQNIFQIAISKISEEKVEITQSKNSNFGHYQCNNAMKLAKQLKDSPRNIADKILASIPENQIIEKMEIAGPGFINITLKNSFLNSSIKNILKSESFDIDRPKKKTIVVDYSSPNIAKEMHVGHLRTTIIGDALSNILEFLGHKVIRLNHVGDWGTQFGMLITYIKLKVDDFSLEKNYSLSQLLKWYQLSKIEFDNDKDFKKQAQEEVVALQNGNKENIKIWKKICEISRIGFNEIYELLNIKNLQERGESFYQPFLENIVKILNDKNLITISEGATCVYLPEFIGKDDKPLPLIVQKSDGGYNYATTDLAAINHRISEEKADEVLYIVDLGQKQHFDMVFAAAKKAGIITSQRVEHIPFGLVLKKDGKKFKTRSGDTEKLIDLLNTAIDKAKSILKEREDLSDIDIDETSKVLGIASVKYSDLACHRASNYVFDYDKMLSFQGNTAAFLLYAYVRTQSIKRKINIDTNTIDINAINLDESELDLALHLVRFNEAINSTVKELLPNRLTDYLYTLAEKFHSFFHNCRVEGSDKQDCRLLLCDLTGKTLKQGLKLLGIDVLEKM